MVSLMFGTLPDGWEESTLGEICRKSGGRIQTGPFGSQLHASDYVPVGVPTVMPANIGDNRIVEQGIARIREEDAERLARHRLQLGDIVYSRRGDVERRALVTQNEIGWLCGTGCLLVRVGKHIVDPVYISHWLGHPQIRAWITQHAIGATMANLNTEILSGVPVVLPSLIEQRAIAGVLGALDGKIESNSRLRELMLSYIEAICAESRSRSSTRTVELRTVLQFNYGKALPKSARRPGNSLVVGSGGIDGSHSSSSVIAPVVIVGRAGQPGAVHLILEDCWPIDSAFWVSSDSPLPVGWVWSTLKSLNLERLQSGSAVPGLNREIALSERIVVPESRELQQISSVTDPLVAAIRSTDREVASLRRLRDALLPGLLSGRLRVGNAKNGIEEAV